MITERLNDLLDYNHHKPTHLISFSFAANAADPRMRATLRNNPHSAIAVGLIVCSAAFQEGVQMQLDPGAALVGKSSTNYRTLVTSLTSYATAQRNRALSAVDLTVQLVYMATSAMSQYSKSKELIFDVFDSKLWRQAQALIADPSSYNRQCSNSESTIIVDSFVDNLVSVVNHRLNIGDPFKAFIFALRIGGYLISGCQCKGEITPTLFRKVFNILLYVSFNSFGAKV